MSDIDYGESRETLTTDEVRERERIERDARLGDALDALRAAVLWLHGDHRHTPRSQFNAEPWYRKARSGIVALRAALAAQLPAQELDDKTFAAESGASAMWRRAAAQDQLSVTERLAWAMHEARGAYGEYGAEDDCDCLSDAEAWMEAH